MVQQIGEEMKIVINKCFGGFGLSVKATDWLWKEGVEEVGHDAIEYYGGPKKTERTKTQKVQEVLEKLDKKDLKWKKELDEDLQRWRDFKAGVSGTYLRSQFSDDEKYVLYAREVPRDHPKLVECVEKLGSKANGEHAELAVVDIPDDVDWEIDEYDGHESIHEKHRTWS